MQHKFFKSEPDNRDPYTIVIPPPNVTGVLHMGHMLNNTIQDVLIRRARMLGYNACWVPGTDHASIATEAKVVALLKEKGINKTDLTREKFLEHAWEWKEKYGGIILEQLKKLKYDVYSPDDAKDFDKLATVLERQAVDRSRVLFRVQPAEMVAVAEKEVVAAGGLVGGVDAAQGLARVGRHDRGEARRRLRRPRHLRRARR